MALQFALFPVTPFIQNCTLLWDDQSKAAVLIDVGGEAQRMLAEVKSRGLNLQAIWLTHGHVDHIGGVVDLVNLMNVPILGPHIEDDFWIQQLPTITHNYRFPHSPVFTPTRWLDEGDKLTLDNHIFEVLHIPGHTPGHIVFYCAAAKLLVAGDVLFLESIGRTDFPRGSHSDLIHHIHQKILVLPEDTQVIAGHGAMTTIGHEKRHNPFLS